MYAIVDIAGQQFKVEKERKIFVHRLSANEGDTVEFEKVLLTDNEGDVKIGAPVLEGAKVTAKVLSHVKGDKVIVFKKKRRKGYKVKNGHRQYLSQIQIEGISIKAPAKKPTTVGMRPAWWYASSINSKLKAEIKTPLPNAMTPAIIFRGSLIQ